MQILLANLPAMLLVGFLFWLAVDTMPKHPGLAWTITVFAICFPVVVGGLYEHRKKDK